MDEERGKNRIQFTEDWYAVRIARLSELCKKHGCWEEASAILANGTVDSSEPPTYAQTLSLLRHEVSLQASRIERAETSQRRMIVRWLRETALENLCNTNLTASEAAIWEIISNLIENKAYQKPL